MLWEPEDVVRVLDPSEQRFVRHGTFTGRSVTVRGELDSAALGAAFAALQRAFPILVCRIVEDDDGRGILLRPGDIDAVGAWVSFGDPDEVRVPAETVDPADQLGYLDVVLAEEDRARVTLFVHHAVADAGYCVELFARLWGYYTDHVETGRITVGTRELPVSLETMLGRRGIGRGARSGLEAVTRPLVVAEAGGSQRAEPAALARPARVQLDPAETARVLELARAHAVSVNGLVTAAVLRAYRRVYGGERVGCVYPVDLRRRLDPPVAAEAGTNVSGLAAFATDDTDDVVDLARRIGTSLHNDLAEGVVEQSVLHFPDYYGSNRIHSTAGHIAVTNTGTVPLFRAPNGLILDDYEIVYLSAHPRPSTGAAAAVTFLVYTYLGRLTIGRLGGGVRAAELLTAVVAELAWACSRETAASA
ncbi:phthiocerol/phthiodiolone dimycocerosyl transferase family protein [Nocardia caishijiensis]|uniref:Phthiocerol/phthiodiolone dimycocerosyl transferase n=1 Tax=Nocardia caishijiensis TaxID=184756 RepID=A0ABQ6YJM3_9NOCA|nr:acyltransferase [Nocardia caishijiensis]KAF0845765.1 phthiocerol/phthiodiolone dimycocerosyl transferase-like enzyme [Nocardia caishijiensis]